MEKQNKNYYGKFYDYFPKVETSFSQLKNINPFVDDSIEQIGESVKYLKENVYNI